jgi:hypothetical protein
MGVFFGSTGMTPWIQTLIVNHLKDSSRGTGTSTTEEQDLPHRPRLVQIVGRGGTWWQNPDVASSSCCYLEITDGQHCIQAHLTPTCQASLRQQHFQYADQCRQGCLIVIEKYTAQILQINQNNNGEIALLATHIQLKGGSETGICHPLEPIQDSVEVKRYLQQYKYKEYQKSKQHKIAANTNTDEPVVIGNVHDLFTSTQGQDTMEQVLQEAKRRQLEQEEEKQEIDANARQEPQGDNDVAMLRVGNVQDLLDSQDVVMEQVLDEARRRLQQAETTIQQPQEETAEEDGEWRVPPVPRKLGNVQDLLQSPETLETVLQLAETAMAAEKMIMEEDYGDDDDQEIVHKKQPQRLGGPSPTAPDWSDSDDDEEDDDAVIGISKLLDSQPTTRALESESRKRVHPERKVKIPGDWSESDDGDPVQVSRPPPLNDDRCSKQRPPIPNYEAVGAIARSPSEKSDKENNSTEQKTIKARALKPIAEKKKPKKRAAAAADPRGGTGKKKKRTTSLWQRLANNQATASIKTKIVTGVSGLSSLLSRNSK